MLNDLHKLIAIKSVMGEPKDGAPFGVGPLNALNAFLDIAEGYGFKVKNENGYCGWAEYGEGEKLIGILGHLDVVPAGGDWSHDPFTLVCEDGLLYGRGVADDKGPTVAALHALKEIKEQNVALGARVRLIVGCNEENGSQCIKYYREHCEIPYASFVPDADFPLINSEKGILHLNVAMPYDDVICANVTKLTAGNRANVVPDNCVAHVKKGSELYKKLYELGKDSSLFKAPKAATVIADCGMRIEDFSAHFFEDKLVLETRGVAGHAMAPQKGENAAVKMINFICGFISSPSLNAFKTHLNAPNPACLLGIEGKDDVSGELTVNTGIVNIENGELNVTLDLRLPLCSNKDAVINKIEGCFKGGKITVLHFSPNLYVPKDSPLIKALLLAYEQTTGKEGKCLYCGGGTYARELNNAVAFGPTFEGLETNIHNVDESFPLELFEKLPQIYKAAIINLAKML